MLNEPRTSPPPPRAHPPPPGLKPANKMIPSLGTM